MPRNAAVRTSSKFWSAEVAYSAKSQGWGTPRPLFLALCRFARGLDPDTPEEDIPLPWLDPCATAASALVPHYYDGRSPERDGLLRSWHSSALGSPGYVYANPPYGNPEEVCVPRGCRKKVCKVRGHCLTERIPGIPDWTEKSRREALAHGMTTLNLLPHRAGAAWFADMLRPGPEAGAWLEGTALPGHLSPLHPYVPTVSWAQYRWEKLDVTVAVLAGRQSFVPEGAPPLEPKQKRKKSGDVAGFDSALVIFKGRWSPLVRVARPSPGG